ncbi:hypothetical protein [Aquimarina sp. 2304DJ70-9]|uniref:hypothetical protein n=1 Tax=Aquimarina penaris TaxID=3231044 RepID=UPI0034636E28
MSDTFITLVPIKIDQNEVDQFSKIIHEELIKRKIITSDDSPGENAPSVVVENESVFLNLENNKLNIVTKRQVFDNGGNELERIKCPECSFNIIDNNWIDAVDLWYSDPNKGQFTCTNCNNTTSITEYVFEPNWGFGNLGLIFWNWPKFKEEFIKDIENLLQSKIKIVFGRL